MICHRHHPFQKTTFEGSTIKKPFQFPERAFNFIVFKTTL